MHNRIPPLYKVSLLATALVTLSGCAVTAEPNRIGESLMDAGRVTANASVKAYEGTKRFLGFDRNEVSEMDEIDMALMDTERTWPTEQPSGAVAQPVNTASAVKIGPLHNIEPPPAGAPAIATIPAVDPNATPVATIDYNHVVGPQETMWTIAKHTTGNANNWRILAEINQLDLNTPMQIGQEILIPADLVLPQIVATVVSDQPLVDPNANKLINHTGTATTAGLAPLEMKPVATLDVEPTSNTETLRPIAAADLNSDPLNHGAGDTLSLGAANEEIVLADAAAAETDATPAAVIDPTINAIALKVDAGETLWDMAKRTTGDATNWKTIAEHNGLTEKDIGRIRYGQEIYVPMDLAKTELGGNNLIVAKAALPVDNAADDSAADAEATDNLVAATATQPAAGSKEEAVDASATLVASASNLMDETKDIKIVEATYQSNETLQVEPAAGEAIDSVIMVSGTYYPKAVYNEADFSSSLLMRVSPGTEMTVSRAMGPWYEVQTEFGIGYMHSRDIK